MYTWLTVFTLSSEVHVPHCHFRLSRNIVAVRGFWEHLCGGTRWPMCIRTGVVFVESAMSYFDHLRPNTILHDCTLTLNRQESRGTLIPNSTTSSKVQNSINSQMSTVVHIGDHSTTRLTSRHAQTRMTICSSTVAQTQIEHPVGHHGRRTHQRFRTV